MNKQTLNNILDFPLMLKSDGNGIFRTELMYAPKENVFKGETQDWTFTLSKKSDLEEKVNQDIFKKDVMPILVRGAAWYGGFTGMLLMHSIAFSLPMTYPVISALLSVSVVFGGYKLMEGKRKKNAILANLFQKDSCVQIRNKNSGKGIHFRYDEKTDKLVVQVRSTGKEIFQKSYTRGEFTQDFMGNLPELINVLSSTKGFNQKFFKENGFMQRPLAELYTQQRT